MTMTPVSNPIDTDAWKEDDSRSFIDLGRIYTPRRDELQGAFLDLIPAWSADEFVGVDLACGDGWLTRAILEEYPRCHMIALDGSEAMRAAAGRNLEEFGTRVEIADFRLEASAWRDELQGDLRCVVSSLAIHHLRGNEKLKLFQDVYSKLAPGGALLIADLIEPAGVWSGRHFGRSWGNDVARQSTQLTQDDAAYRKFMDDHWNYYENTDEENEGDYPSTVAEHIDWLREAEFSGVDLAWSRAGHTLFCAYREEG